MRGQTRKLTVLMVGLVGAGSTAGLAEAAQVDPIDGGTLRPLRDSPTPRERILLLEDELLANPSSYDANWRLAMEYTTLAAFEDEAATQLQLGYVGRAYALSAKEMHPDSLDSRYWVAAASGLLASLESGRTIIRLADEAWRESGWVLEADSLHAGAHYIRGRLHAAIQRQSAFRRFIARTLFGAEAVAEASWALAEYHLRRAAELDPALPMYHFELAAALRDMGRSEQAQAALVQAYQAAGSSPLDERYRGRAGELLGIRSER